MTRFLLKASFVVLMTLFLLATYSPAWALYEVKDARANVATGLTPQQPPAVSLQVNWTAPDMNAGDSIKKYVYIWNNSDVLLDDTQLSQTVYDNDVDKDDILMASKNSGDFAGEDYNDSPWYFHIKTVYFSTTEGEKLGDDLVVGPFNFDDQSPEGTISLDTSVVGQTATTSSVNPVTLTLTATPDTKTVYLNNTATMPSTGVDFATTLTYTVTEGEGSKTIYAWFEDQAGNQSSFYTLTFTIIAGKSMDPSGDLQLATGVSQTFTILGKGDTEVFNWEFVSPNPSDVASFSGSSPAASIAVVGNKAGTFKVKATSTTDSAIYTSGTITVSGCAYIRGDTNKDGEITAQDAVDAFWLSFNTEWTFDELCTADHNQDGEVTSQDAVDIFWASF